MAVGVLMAAAFYSMFWFCLGSGSVPVLQCAFSITDPFCCSEQQLYFAFWLLLLLDGKLAGCCRPLQEPKGVAGERPAAPVGAGAVQLVSGWS